MSTYPRFPRRSASALSALALALVAPLAAAGPPPAERLTSELFSELEFRFIGPVGNRVTAVTGVPGNGAVFYAGAASGGIFRTTDGGAHWRPVFDDQPAASIGALAVAPSDPKVVWVGTGESFLRGNVSVGNGVYRSLDGGESWRHLGLEATGRIARIVVDPRDPDVAWVAALGHCYGPQPERGVFKTVDGGASWRRLLFVDEATGASDLALDPTNPRILFAGTWQMTMSTSGRTSGGPGSGLFRSTDSGESWQRLEGRGLPEPPWGKVAVAVAASDPRRVYALIETSSNAGFAPADPHQGVLWRSEDGGESWRLISGDHTLVQRPLYYSRAVVAPDDRDEVHFLAVEHSRSLDGGATYGELDSGWDHHDLWIDPLEPGRMIVGHDGGVSLSINRGESWLRPLLPNAQLYHVAVDRQLPYHVYGNRQDGSSLRGPSNTLTDGEIPVGAWEPVGGCEVGFTVPSPADPAVVWTGCYDGILHRFDLREGQARDVSVWPLAAEGWGAEELDYRFQWSFPIAVSPHDPRRVYAGSQYLHRTTDGGQSWRVMSPDLTSDDPALKRRTGGLTLDDAGPTLAPTIFALAESPLEAGLIWAGTNDGRVQLTRDGGETWTDVSAAIPGLPPGGTVTSVEPSPHAAGTCYVTVDRHQLADPAPYVFATDDHGATWRPITGDLPRDVFGYAHCVREDPERPGLLYLGTENSLHLSWDAGDRWHRLRAGLPPAPVSWIAVQPDFGDLVLSTYGRGFYVLDDLGPLRQLSGEALEAPAHLFAPRPAHRFRLRAGPMSHPEDPAAGENPAYGALLHYHLADEAGEEEREVAIVLLDVEGEVVRRLEDLPAEPGLHRVAWDLEYEKTPEVKLRTRPLEHPHERLPEEGWRPLIDGGRLAVLAPPGSYTVRLEVGEETLEQPLEVLADPRSSAGEEDLRRQAEALKAVRAEVEAAAGLINDLEWLRRQLLDLAERLEARPPAPPEATGEGTLAAAVRALEGRLLELEGELFDPRLTSASQDTLRTGRRLYARLVYLGESIGASDHRPTDQQLEVARLLSEQLAGLRERFARLCDKDLAELERRFAEAGVGPVIR